VRGLKEKTKINIQEEKIDQINQKIVADIQIKNKNAN
jgi:hypothetical protein